VVLTRRRAPEDTMRPRRVIGASGGAPQLHRRPCVLKQLVAQVVAALLLCWVLR